MPDMTQEQAERYAGVCQYKWVIDDDCDVPVCEIEGLCYEETDETIFCSDFWMPRLLRRLEEIESGLAIFYLRISWCVYRLEWREAGLELGAEISIGDTLCEALCAAIENLTGGKK